MYQLILKIVTILFFLSSASLYSMDLESEVKKAYKSYNDFLIAEKEKTNLGNYVSREPLKSNDLVLHTDIIDIGHLLDEPFTGLIFEGEKTLKDEKCQNLRKRIVSFVKFIVKEAPNGDSVCEVGYIETTKKKNRNKGYASLLLRSLEDEMHRTNCSTITLCAVSEKIPFYEKKKFKMIDCKSNRMEKKRGEI